MKIANVNLDARLDNNSIKDIVDQATQFLKKLDIEQREAVRYTLVIEEILLSCQERFSEETPVVFSAGSRLGSPYLQMVIRGEAYNVFAANMEENGALGESVLRNLGLAPEYNYKANGNSYYFRLHRKKRSPLFTLLIVLISACVVGLGGRLFPTEIRTTLLDDVFDPLHNAFVHMLGCLAGPMVFLSVAWGIYGIGDAATLKRIGKKMLLHNIWTVYACIAIGALLCIPFFHLEPTSGELISGVGFLFSMLLDVIPSSVVSPFVEGNTLQIIFMAFIMGIAMLLLGQKTNAVAKAIEQINYILQLIIEFISKMVPYFIFIVIVSMIWSDVSELLGKLGKMFGVYLLTVLAAQAYIIGHAAIKNRVSPLLLMKKGFSTFLIAFTTASSAAAFNSNVKTCRDEYGIDPSVTAFGVPLGIVTLKPTTSLNYLLVSVFFAEMYAVSISPSWIFLLLITCGVLALATPPIPGGGMTAYTVLFAQLGIPAEAIAIALACDMLFDFVSTGFDQFSIPIELLNSASRLGLVNRETLCRQEEKFDSQSK